MRSFTAIFLLFALMLTNFSRVFIYAGFDLNQKYIASTLCENRDKPMLHCNGKCYLARKLKQAEQKERDQNRADQKSHFQEALMTQKMVYSPPVQFLKAFRAAEIPFALPMHSAVVFHPPQV